MEQQAPMAAAARLANSVDALAALAAYVRVESEPLDVTPQVRELLASVAAELLGGGPPPSARLSSRSSAWRERSCARRPT